MSSVRLITAGIAPDIKCPYCGQGLDIDEWGNTEYGEPQQGQSTEECCNCGKKFTLETEISVTYYTSKYRRGNDETN